MKTILYRWLPMCAILFATGPVIAQGTDPSAALRQYEALRKYEGTLKKIDETRTIRIGHRQNSIPFAFVDPKGKPVGYALDLCDAVVEEIETELGKEIKVELVPVTPENRFDLVTSGQIDLECGLLEEFAPRRIPDVLAPFDIPAGDAPQPRRRPAGAPPVSWPCSESSGSPPQARGMSVASKRRKAKPKPLRIKTCVTAPLPPRSHSAGAKILRWRWNRSHKIRVSGRSLRFQAGGFPGPLARPAAKD